MPWMTVDVQSHKNEPKVEYHFWYLSTDEFPSGYVHIINGRFWASIVPPHPHPERGMRWFDDLEEAKKWVSDSILRIRG